MENYHSPHYLQHVTEGAEQATVIAHEDIVTSNGIKLVNKGSRIDKSFYRHLLQHKLLKPIDYSLTIESDFDKTSLLQYISDSAGRLKLLPGIGQTSDTIDLLKETFSLITLEAPLHFKLFLSHQRLPKLFEHSLQVAILAVLLGAQINLGRTRLVQLATAGLFHDLGLLHVDPELLDSNHQFTADDWKQIYTHPIIAYLFLKEFPEYHPDISTAVLEHHERADGSGYPHGRPAIRTALSGQILAVAELAAAISSSDAPMPKLRLMTIIKFTANQYNQTIIAALFDLLASKGEQEEEVLVYDQATFDQQLDKLWQILQKWEELHGQRDSQGAFCTHVESRLHDLKHAVTRSGLIMDETNLNDQRWRQAAATSAETQILLREALFQIHNINQEIQRRCFNLPDTEHDARMQQWHEAVNRILG
jgi:HD-GYP domain-containing protein (c-di-GMP phosphodiesterase class II)